MNKVIELNRDAFEVELFKEIYHKLSNKELSEIFNRSINSIQHKATRMGLHKDKEFLKKSRSQRSIGDKCNWWKGGKKITLDGYVQISKIGYPGTDKNGYIFEHRFNMEKFIGRHLNSNEIVHHINGKKQDNRIENLKLMTNAEHTIYHHTGELMSDKTKQIIRDKALQRFNDITTHPSYKNIEISELIKLRNEGNTVTEICKAFGITRRTFYNKTQGKRRRSA